MDVSFGKGETQFGPGVEINLTGDELATAIDAYLVAHGVDVDGARTIYVDGKLCSATKIIIDPSGSVTWGGIYYPGRG